jgi:hypothetical protein
MHLCFIFSSIPPAPLPLILVTLDLTRMADSCCCHFSKSIHRHTPPPPLRQLVCNSATMTFCFRTYTGAHLRILSARCRKRGTLYNRGALYSLGLLENAGLRKSHPAHGHYDQNLIPPCTALVDESATCPEMFNTCLKAKRTSVDGILCMKYGKGNVGREIKMQRHVSRDN